MAHHWWQISIHKTSLQLFASNCGSNLSNCLWCYGLLSPMWDLIKSLEDFINCTTSHVDYLLLAVRMYEDFPDSAEVSQRLAHCWAEGHTLEMTIFWLTCQQIQENLRGNIPQRGTLLKTNIPVWVVYKYHEKIFLKTFLKHKDISWILKIQGHICFQYTMVITRPSESGKVIWIAPVS